MIVIVIGVVLFVLLLLGVLWLGLRRPPFHVY